MVLVDSNVLLDILTSDPKWRSWSASTLAEIWHTERSINPIIFAEVSANFHTATLAEEAMSPKLYAWLPLPYEAAFLAGQAFRKYRKRGGQKRSPLPDFYIGAHATVENLTVLTRDPRRYRTYFPQLQLIHP